MARRGCLFALAVLAAAVGAHARGLMAQKGGAGMMQQSGSGDANAVFSRGRATSGDAYLVANTVQFDAPPEQVDADQFRSTVADFFKLDSSQVLINRVYPLDGGTAVDFFALFPDDDAAETFETTFNDPQQLRAVFAAAPALSNPRLVAPGSDAQSSSSSAQAPAPRGAASSSTATAGAGGKGMGGAGGAASGAGAQPGAPGVGTPGAPGTVTTSGGD